MSTLYTLQHTPELLQASHGPIRKTALFLQMGFYAVVTILTWTNVANLFLTLLLVFGQAITRAKTLPVTLSEVIFAIVYFAMILLQLMMGIAGKLDKSLGVYQSIVLLCAYSAPLTQCASGRRYPTYTLFDNRYYADCLMMIFSFAIGIWLLATNGA